MADLLVDALGRAGAEALFVAGRGEAIEALVDAARHRGIRVVDVGSARTACAMAAVTGLLSDAPGFAAAAPGESGGDVIASLEQAVRDGAPLVLVTARPLGEVPGAVPETGVATTRDAAIKASLPIAPGAAAHWSAHACQLALGEPRGPVHLIVSPDVASAPAVPLATPVRPGPLPGPPPAVLDAAGDMLARARHPILIAGRQCRTVEIATWLRALAEALPAPALVTAGGKGAFPDPHPLHLGVVGRAGAAGAILGRADLAVAIGLDARELDGGALPAALPLLRLVAAPWGRPDVAPELEVVGDIALVVEELAPRLRGRAGADWDVAELDRLKRGAAGLLPERARAVCALVDLVRGAMPAGTVAVAAAGDDSDAVVAAWQAVAPGELVAPTPPRLPGFGLAAAVAAAIARPRARVVCFASAPELAAAPEAFEVAARLALPVVVLALGEEGHGGMTALLDAGARSGWSAVRARSPLALRMALERTLTSAGPALVDTQPGRG